MDFSFSNFEEFMSFVKTTGKEISGWPQEKVDKFNNHVWKLQENPEFNKKYMAWEKEVIAITEKRKTAQRSKTSRGIHIKDRN